MATSTIQFAPNLTQPHQNYEPEMLHRWMGLEPEELTSISHIKRFTEYYEADPEFRNNIVIAPDQTVAKYNLKIPLEEIRWLWDKEFAKSQQTQGIPFPPSIQLFIDYETAHNQWVDRWRTQMPDSDPRFQSWRDRQMARLDGEISKLMNAQIAHSPVCFELSKGCSVGCWFCGVSAPRFSDIFTYTPENAQLWREVLEVIKEIGGPAAGAGFCYWATDPLDNPDYENFVRDFHAILGTIPQTTTAQPMKDPARLRSFLKFSDSKGFAYHRFSILSLKILENVFAEFSPEELIRVGLVLQNKESIMNKAVAGRSLEKQKKAGEVDDDQPVQSTIACVTGFLFNMVERSVKLISPCKADDRWPNGYRVYDRGTFETASDLRVLLERMMTQQMPLGIRPDIRLRFRRDLKHENLDDGFKVSTRFLALKFRHRPLIKELGEAILKGDKTAKEIVAQFEQLGVPTAEINYSLNLMFNRGILDDEPQQG
ncbi:radical SAM family RiPP maturation amino acid epimerase [Kamptonema sp. UHCC 0994]|uniref:radical SAM family RiPP maturation amino acid epimerase n=1 Tax=Kamptonema sp. UHCC 0994 TaxID=3031329 RepID=UPI0023BA1D9F|nr:radical SAM family RiPP maturation amino acid epimerase [Kamptonema sp. UHCC 0994]MDF0555977.1 radical SAM family RiPP maturation amino acid epimerase [Kamptonema sp. UHCC 0994]